MAAWDRLVEGNRRFVAGRPAHPGQDAGQRATSDAGRRPHAIVFGCSDSRVAAEIIFDQGLGDLFVVRTAGHVVDLSVLGSLEFGVEALDLPLVVVLGHDRCDAVVATVDSLRTRVVPDGFVRDIVERVTPSVVAARRGPEDLPGFPTHADLALIEAEHVRQTAALIVTRSRAINRAVQIGRCGVVAAAYSLSDGEVRLVGTTAHPDAATSRTSRA